VNFVILLLFILSFVHIVVPLTYYGYMRRISKRSPWNLHLNPDYEPKISIIVSTFNEANVIVEKIKNISQLDYPKNKLELIIVDSASSDGTSDLAEKYIKAQDFQFKVYVLKETERRGKSSALNYALKTVTGEVVATSDADCLWPPDSLRKAIIYLSDSSVGAVCGHEVPTNPNHTIATKTENTHRSFFNEIRIGESKLNSTVVFEGGLALFKTECLQKFNEYCDDSGSALDIVQGGHRTLILPDVFFQNPFPTAWSIRSRKKIRRAQHLISVFWRCLKLDISKKNKLNPLISKVNVFLYIFNPFLFLFFISNCVLVFYEYPLTLLIIPFIVFIPKIRRLATVYITDYFFLLVAAMRELLGKKQIVWKK
jgi:poly-beta-1,6-N-acetyl-D-glucosamine synthase